jgi:hypothetical protein
MSQDINTPVTEENGNPNDLNFDNHRAYTNHVLKHINTLQLKLKTME